MKPRVVIDARIVGPEMNGISRYIRLLTQGLARIRDESGLPYDPIFLTRMGHWPEATSAFCGFSTHPIRAPFLDPAELWEVPAAIRSLRASNGAPVVTVYHSPSFSSLFACPVPWVVTVHDLIHLKFGNLPQRLYYRWLLRPFVRGATARVTISDFSREEIARWANVPSSTIDIVPIAIDPAFASGVDAATRDAALKDLGLSGIRYVFCLSNPKRHKNVSFLIDAYGEYRRRSESRQEEPVSLLVNVPVMGSPPGVISRTSLTQPAIRALMSGATAFAFPSLYEGFGIPPLEAGILGVPVIVSVIPAHREAMRVFASDEVSWADPDDREAWIQALEAAGRGQLPRPRTESSVRAVSEFDVKKTGQKMDWIYRRVLNLPRDDA
jgi:glycosyltransferase involved in cell wall biosynthesis